MIAATDFGAVFTAVATRGDSERIAEVLLSEKLVACVQIAAIDSRYVWKGAVAREAEFLLTIKTRAALFEAVIARIKTLHPYETPEITALPFAAGSGAYFSWIAEVTGTA